MDPTKIEPNQDTSAPASASPLGVERGSIAVDISSSVVERPAGIESSHPEVHETAEGFIQPNLSAQPPIAEINAQLEQLGMPPASLTSGLNTSQARADKLREGPAESGRTWVGFLVTKFNKVAALFRPKQSINQPI